MSSLLFILEMLNVRKVRINKVLKTRQILGQTAGEMKQTLNLSD